MVAMTGWDRSVKGWDGRLGRKAGRKGVPGGGTRCGDMAKAMAG